MLKLSLKPGEYITLGDNIKIIFLRRLCQQHTSAGGCTARNKCCQKQCGQRQKAIALPHHIPSERIPRNTHMEVKFYKYGSTTQHAGSQCQQNVRSYNKRTVQKR